MRIVLIKVMTAASYWSLLAPAIEMASQSELYGKEGQFAFVPVSVGFLLGAAFVYYADVFMTYLVGHNLARYSEVIPQNVIKFMLIDLGL